MNENNLEEKIMEEEFYQYNRKFEEEEDHE